MTTAVALTAIFLASFFATASGFGFALVATPILSLVLPIKFTVIAVLLATLFLRIITMYRTRGQFDWRTVALTSVGGLFGAWPGSWLLKYITVEHLEIFLGVVLLAASCALSRGYSVNVKNKTLGRLSAGFLSSFFGTATSVSGPPLILYFLNEHTEKTVMRANMIWIFGITGALSVLTSYLAGNFAFIDDWQLLLTMIPAVLLGILGGEKAFQYLNQQLFQRLALAIVCFGAVAIVANGLLGLLNLTR